MVELITKHKIVTLEPDDRAVKLANMYISEGIILNKYFTDALHIAFTTIKILDYIVSLNFTHIIKTKTIEKTSLINQREGYKKVGIYSPIEVVKNDR
jgi:hypothetical protein